MDLVSYVEFQTNYEGAIRYHKSTLRSIRKFWRTLVEGRNVSIKSISASFRAIEKAEQRAASRYRVLISRFPKSIRLLRTYAHFLRQVMVRRTLFNRQSDLEV